MCRTAYSKEHGWYIIKSCKPRNLIVQHPCNINLYSIQFLLPLNSQRIGNELLFSSIHFKMLVIKKKTVSDTTDKSPFTIVPRETKRKDEKQVKPHQIIHLKLSQKKAIFVICLMSIIKMRMGFV